MRAMPQVGRLPRPARWADGCRSCDVQALHLCIASKHSLSVAN
jgi:hypothetical protein